MFFVPPPVRFHTAFMQRMLHFVLRRSVRLGLRLRGRTGLSTERALSGVNAASLAIWFNPSLSSV